MDKRAFRMPYKYFRDRDTINFEQTQPEMVCPYNCHKLLLWKGPDGRKYLVNRKNRAYMAAQGPFKPPYFLLEDQLDKYASHDAAFILCPGPSMDQVDLSAFKDKLTFTVNSAGFKFNSTFWVAAESNWLLWVRGTKKLPMDRSWIMTSRVAVRARGLGMTPNFKEVFVSRLEEEWIQPHRTPAISTMTSFFSAWWLGVKKVYVIGLDLSRPGKQAYVKGVPFSDFGATNPFTEQILALHQFVIPEFQVFNGSPHSQSKLPFEKINYKDIEKIARDAPTCHTNQESMTGSQSDQSVGTQ